VGDFKNKIMTIELKDVLHFYLGCEAIMSTDDWHVPEGDQLVRITGIMDNGQYIAYARKGSFGNYESKNFKPLLRPLSSMTEEEKKEVLRISDKYSGKNLIPIYVNHILNFFFHSANPEIIRYLFLRRFDLFGLIESGAAIDKTQQ
jgi:hypothetical protein